MVKSKVSVLGTKFCIETRKAKAPVCYLMSEDFKKKFERKIREKTHDFTILNEHYEEFLVKQEQPNFNFKEWLEEKEREAEVK